MKMYIEDTIVNSIGQKSRDFPITHIYEFHLRNLVCYNSSCLMMDTTEAWISWGMSWGVPDNIPH